FLKVSAVLATTLAIASPQFSGSITMRWGLAACCLVVVVVALGFQRMLRDDRGYTKMRWLAVSYVLMTVASIGVCFVGVYSPAPMVGTLGIYFLCLGSSLRVALASYITGALLHLVPAMLIALGHVHDPGLFPARDSTVHDKVLAALLVQMVYGLTFV